MSIEPTPDVEPDDKPTSTRNMDPEILLLSRIARMLDSLDEDAQRRVISYLAARYTPLKDFPP